MSSDYLFRQEIFDEQQNKYYIVGRTDDENVLCVTPVGGNGGPLHYCIKHQIAYPVKSNCEGCRLDVIAEPVG